MKPVHRLEAKPGGIRGSAPTLPLRDVLVLHQNTLDEFRINPGDLRENILLSDDGSESLVSGSELVLGTARIRLTYFCEVCKKISAVERIKDLSLKRGILGEIVSAGSISLGDRAEVHSGVFAEIPHRIADRIKWYLDSNPQPIMLAELVRNIGLSTSYCRAIPRLIESRADIDKSLILTRTHLDNAKHYP